MSTQKYNHLAVVNTETTCALCRTSFGSHYALEQHMISRHAATVEPVAPMRFSADDAYEQDDTIKHWLVDPDLLHPHFH